MTSAETLKTDQGKADAEVRAADAAVASALAVYEATRAQAQTLEQKATNTSALLKEGCQDSDC